MMTQLPPPPSPHVLASLPVSRDGPMDRDTARLFRREAHRLRLVALMLHDEFAATEQFLALSRDLDAAADRLDALAGECNSDGDS